MSKRSDSAEPAQLAALNIDSATLRRLAVSASCDPRTILAVASGRLVRGLAGERARAVLLAAGLLRPAGGK